MPPGLHKKTSANHRVVSRNRLGQVADSGYSLDVITDDTVLKSSPEMKYQSLGAGQPTVIVSLTSGYLYTANQTTQSFLQAIDGRKTFGAIVAELVEQYDVSAEKLAADMRTLAGKLVSEKLLTIAAEATPHA